MPAIPPFPQIPHGDPGAIESGARSLKNAAAQLEDAGGRVSLGASALSSSWEGEAATAYHGSAAALAGAARGVGETIRSCASGAERYAELLSRTQAGMRRLKTQYDDAVQRYNRLSGQLATLNGQLAGAHDLGEKARLQGQIGGVAQQVGSAQIEATGYVTAAPPLRADFEREQLGCMRQIAHGSEMPGWLGGPNGLPVPHGVPASLGGPIDGAAGVAGSLSADGGILTLRLPERGGGTLATIDGGSGAVSSATGICEGFGWWEPVVDVVCGGGSLLSGAVSAGPGWARVVTGQGSVAGAAANTGLAGLGASSFGLGKLGARLAEGGETARIVGPSRCGSPAASSRPPSTGRWSQAARSSPWPLTPPWSGGCPGAPRRRRGPPDYFSSRDSRRSLSSLPSVWQVGQ